MPKGTEENVTTVNPSTAFLSAFALHPAGVAVVTAVSADNKPVGFTATSLSSFSAQPPRASFNIARHASTYPALTVDSPVLIHFLAENQVNVARTMAGNHDSRFDGDHWSPDGHGLPRIRDARAVLEAHVVSITEVGDNAAVIVEIDGGDTHDDRKPLVYVERRYHSIGEIVKD